MKRYKKLTLTFFFLFLSASLLLNSIFSNFGILSYLYRQNLYFYLAIKHYKGDFQSIFTYSHKVTKLNNFENTVFNSSKQSPSIDCPSSELLIYGRSWCDGQAFIFMEILSQVEKRDSRELDVQNHTLCEIKIDNKWIPIDPFYQIFFRDKSGKYLSLQAFQKAKDENILLPINHQLTIAEIRKIYIEYPVRWPNGRGPLLLSYHDNLFHKIANFFNSFAIKIFGLKYIYFIQDKYLNSLSPKNIKRIFPYEKVAPTSSAKNFLHYYKARSYLLMSRFIKASKTRKKISNDSQWAKRYDILLSRRAY